MLHRAPIFYSLIPKFRQKLFQDVIDTVLVGTAGVYSTRKMQRFSYHESLNLT
jgi:hypothetical protein